MARLALHVGHNGLNSLELAKNMSVQIMLQDRVL